MSTLELFSSCGFKWCNSLYFLALCFLLYLFSRNMYGDETDSSEQTKVKPDPPVVCKGLELMKVSYLYMYSVCMLV